MMDPNGNASSKVKSASDNKILGIPRKFLLIGCGCLAFLCICLVAVAIIIGFSSGLFSGLFGGDPIPALAPENSAFIMSVDLLKVQSSNVADIAQVFQDMAGMDTGQDMIATLDESMYSEMNMTFTDDVMPWIGKNAGLIIYDFDPNSSATPQLSFVVSVRSKSKADTFIENLVAYLEDNGDRFESMETDGVIFYSSNSGDMTIARSGNNIFFGTSQFAIQNSIGLKKADSIAGTDAYKKTIAVLPKGQLATIYANGSNFQKYFDILLSESGLSYIFDTNIINFNHIFGVALGIAADKDGLRLDYATAFDPDVLSTSQIDSLDITYTRSNIENMVPEDTFLYSAFKSSKGPGYLLESGGLLDNPDIQEALDLLEKEYAFSLQDFLNSLSGEYGLAISPARDGVMAQSVINIGITFIAGITDESNLTEMILKVLDTNMGNLGGYSIEDVTYGKYDLQGLMLDEFNSLDPSLVFGEDQGFFILGTSAGDLSDSLGGTRSLADSAKYRQTLKAFPSSSIPVLYVDLVALVDLIEKNDPSAFSYDMPGIPGNIEKVPVFAMMRNKSSKYASSASIMLFVDTGK